MKYLYVALLALFIPMAVSAHSGNTDIYGCHTCYTNCYSYGLTYGQYHCHTPKPYAPPVPTCPSMSSYNSLTGSCKCFSGYVVDTDFLGREVCVSADSKCTDDYGYGAQYDSLSKSCECRYGYVMSGSKCVSESQYCTGLIGFMSRYNSLTDKCECMAGYQYDGLSCVYKSSYYGSYSGYSADSTSCPLNSHTSLTDSTKCTCDTGYETNLAKDACVIKSCSEGYIMKSGSCITYTSDCQLSFGDNVYGIKGTNNSSCYCNAGYVWNSTKTRCEVEAKSSPSSASASYNNQNLNNNFVKVSSRPGVYWLSADNKKYLFPNRDTFGSWFEDDFSGLKEVTQDEFDLIDLGGNITVKTGNYIKFDNSDIVYLVKDGSNICKSSNYAGVSYLIQSAFEINYTKTGDCAN